MILLNKHIIVSDQKLKKKKKNGKVNFFSLIEYSWGHTRRLPYMLESPPGADIVGSQPKHLGPCIFFLNLEKEFGKNYYNNVKHVFKFSLLKKTKKLSY